MGQSNVLPDSEEYYDKVERQDKIRDKSKRRPWKYKIKI